MVIGKKAVFIKATLGFVGLTLWVILVSMGVYRFNNHSALEERTLLYECSSELLKNKGVDVSNHSWIYIEKYGTTSVVTFETPLIVPYVSGESFTCVLDSRGIVQEVWDY